MLRRFFLALAPFLLLAGCFRPGFEDTGTCVPASEAPVVSARGVRVYHLAECRYARELPDDGLLGYYSPGEAEITGRIPCAVCNPRENFKAADIRKASAAGPGSSAPRSGP
jgi:hypothetical protein